MEIDRVNLRTENSGSNKSLLNNGKIPGIIYGKGTEPTKIIIEDKYLKKLISTGSFYSKILDIKVEDKDEKVLPKELQYHPVTEKIIHIDLMRVQENTKVTVDVPAEYLNQDICPGLKKGGVLNSVRRTIELICNANNIPEKLQFDLAEIDIGDAIKISSIELPENVQLTIRDRDFVVATIVAPTIEVEEEKPEEEGEGEGVEGEGVEGEGVESTEEEKTEGKKEEQTTETKEVKQEKKEDKK